MSKASKKQIISAQVAGETEFWVNVLYTLARDSVPIGELQRIITDANHNANSGDDVLFCNNFLEDWARQQISIASTCVARGIGVRERQDSNGYKRTNKYKSDKKYQGPNSSS